MIVKVKDPTLDCSFAPLSSLQMFLLALSCWLVCIHRMTAHRCTRHTNSRLVLGWPGQHLQKRTLKEVCSQRSVQPLTSHLPPGILL